MQHNTARTWDYRVAEDLQSLNAALLLGQLFHHFKNLGEFSKTNEELAKEVGMPLRTFNRTKKLLIQKEQITVKNTQQNRSVYTYVKKLDYFDRSYRKYDINFCLISKCNYSGVLLGHLIYLDDYFSSRGEMNFYKTNESLMNDLFMSSYELKNAKKNLIDLGLISVERKDNGRSYYTIHHDKIFSSTVSINASVVPKLTHQLCQNSPSAHYINIYNNIYLFYLLLKPNPQARDIYIQNSRKEKKLNKNNEKYKNTIHSNQKGGRTMEELIEAHTMIGIWKEKIPNQQISPSAKLLNDLQEVLEARFEGSMDRWKDYVDRIARNEYLSGQNNPDWNPKLSWFAQTDIVDKVIGGYFGSEKIKKSSSKPTAIPFTKEEFLSEALDKDLDPLVQKARVTIIDLFAKSPTKLGLASYQSHFRNADFSVLKEKGKKTLVINSFYGSYTSLTPYHGLIAMACIDFDEILIFSGPNDRRGDYIHTAGRETPSDSIFEVWHGLKSKEHQGVFKRNLNGYSTNMVNEFRSQERIYG